MKKTLLLVTPFLLASPALAQKLTLRGKVEDVSGTTNQFFVDCTNVSLASNSIDLNAFVGQQTEMTGAWNGDTAAPAIVVHSLEVVPESFEIGGSGSLGTDLSYEVNGPAGALAAAYFSAKPGFAPIRQGVVLIDPGAFSRVGQGVIPSKGTIQFKVTIPKDPGLVGRTAYGQGVYLFGGQATVTNPDCKEIRD